MASNKPFDRRLRISNTAIVNKAWDPDDNGGGSGGPGGSVDTNKIVSIVVSGAVQPGLQGVNQRIPISGMVKKVTMSLVQASASQFTFDVQKCSAADYVATQNWTSVLSVPRVVAANTLADTAIMGSSNVNEGDYLRAVITGTPSNAIGLSLEAEIEVV